ncbi:MFS transporter [Aestuariimicrobium kwangyangense]|uniref:MFS transporter n=1 Tax=Aestuariimicrobium kwangyangense TaxID=396389 RepID=UPI0003B4B273|nr:MFS transporter [Aestuariimicrobium kwangyangense]
MPRTVPDWARVSFALVAIGWGANQFAPMVQVYRQQVSLSASTATALFGLYAAGLVPTLLVAGWWSAHRGKRPFVRFGAVTSLVSSLVLAVNTHHTGGLLLGRILAGVAIGAAMAPGTAWVKQLSSGSPGIGARRATVALSTGFGGGALVAALLTELPHPTVLPYLVHLLVAMAAAVLVWRTPELDQAALDLTERPAPRAGTVVTALRSRWFLAWVPLTAPWVFGSATLSFLALPTGVGATAGPLAAHVVLLIGVGAAVTLGTGVALQPTIRQVEDAHPGVTLPTGLAVLIAALALAAVSRTHHPLLPVAWVVFGAAYGLLLVGGLRTIETHTPVEVLAPVSAVFYALTYIGFAAPWTMTVATRGQGVGRFSFGGVLAAGAAVALLGLVVGWSVARLDRPGVEPAVGEDSRQT